MKTFRGFVVALVLAGCADEVAQAPGSSTGVGESSSSVSSSSEETGATESPTGSGAPGTSSGGDTSSGTSSGTSTGESSGGDDDDTSAGEPLDCGISPPCAACECAADGWSCDCPAMAPEAGYIEVEPVDFIVGAPGKQQARTSDVARIFYSFRPADDPNAGGPLFVHFNGGPGVSTGILMGFGTGPVRVDAGIVDNPASWTALGDLLYIDARDTGLSYLRTDDVEDFGVRNAAFGLQNFNIFIDAADFVRVLLRFLIAHPQLLKREVVIVGESYGGTRAAVLLSLLLFRGEYTTGGSGRYQDASLVDEIDGFLAVRAPEVEDWTAAEIAEVFGKQVLIQPGIGVRQREIAGDLLELPGSPVHALAQELGLQFETCATQPPNCEKWANATAFVESIAQRSRFDLEADSAWLSESFARTKARLSDLPALAAVLGVPPQEIPWLQPAARGDAFRMGSAGAYPGDGGTIGQLGALAGWDRYYLPFVAEINVAFRSQIAYSTGSSADEDLIVSMMLHNMVYVDTFITSATRDIAIYAPSIPATLATFNNEVDGVKVEEGEFTVEYAGAPYAGEPAPGSRTVRFPVYDASHSVAEDQPMQLREDVAAWLAGG